jgi:hypothetical protein
VLPELPLVIPPVPVVAHGGCVAAGISVPDGDHQVDLEFTGRYKLADVTGEGVDIEDDRGRPTSMRRSRSRREYASEEQERSCGCWPDP